MTTLEFHPLCDSSIVSHFIFLLCLLYLSRVRSHCYLKYLLDHGVTTVDFSLAYVSFVYLSNILLITAFLSRLRPSINSFLTSLYQLLVFVIVTSTLSLQQLVKRVIVEGCM